MPAWRRAASTVGRSAPTTPPRPTSSCEHVGPRATPSTSPFAETIATSVFEPAAVDGQHRRALTHARSPWRRASSRRGRNRGRRARLHARSWVGMTATAGARHSLSEPEHDRRGAREGCVVGARPSAPAPPRAGARRPCPGRATRVAAAVENTIAAISGPASSSGPCRNCAAWSDSAGKRAASFSVRAPISAAAARSAAREERQHGAVVQPVGQRRGGRIGAGQEPLGIVGGRRCAVVRLCAERLGDGGHQHERGGEGHRRRAVLLARSRVEVDVGEGGERVVDAVRDGDDGRARVALRRAPRRRARSRRSGRTGSRTPRACRRRRRAAGSGGARRRRSCWRPRRPIRARSRPGSRRRTSSPCR